MKITIPEKKKLVYEMRIPIRWGDMDGMHHVNNTIYFRYMEVIRIDWARAIGCQPDPQGQGLIIVNAFCTFYKQLEYPGDVLARMYVSDPGRSSFESWCTMERAEAPGTIYAAGGATTVWVDFRSQKSQPIPDWLRPHLE
jgi:acyl-CoA thioester hydrolase